MAAGADAPLLLCYDGSEPAQHAIVLAADLLRPRHALVLTVWEPAAGVGTFAWQGAAERTLEYAEFDRAASELGERIVAEGARIAEDGGFHVEPLAVEATGSVWTTILEVAERRNVSMIVLGSRGLTGMRSILLGSVSTALVHRAKRPTVVIRGPGDEGVALPGP